MQAWEFERAVFELEEVRIVVRADSDTVIGAYEFQRCASASTRLSDWLRQRVYGAVGDEYEVSVIDGNGTINPHGLTQMGTLRETYAH